MNKSYPKHEEMLHMAGSLLFLLSGDI